MLANDVKQLRSRAKLSQEDLAKLLGTSWVTVSRWERKVTEPNPEKQAILHRLRELIKRIGKAIPEERLVNFLMTPNPLLRGYRPVELLESDYSFEDLLSFVEAAKSGDMA
jgi:transcriptional regulator with XRE-family HTH domain